MPLTIGLSRMATPNSRKGAICELRHVDAELRRRRTEPLQTQTPSAPSGLTQHNKDNSSGDKPAAVGVHGVSVPVCTYRPYPSLTKEPKAAKFHGAVLADTIVKLDGRLTHIRILTGAGTRHG
jgi:hypothetical protein